MAHSGVLPTYARDANQFQPGSFAFRFETRIANGTRGRLSVHSGNATSPVRGLGHVLCSGDSTNYQKRERRRSMRSYSQRRSVRQAWFFWPTGPAFVEHVSESQRFRSCCRTTRWNRRFRSSNPDHQVALTTLRSRLESWPLSPRGATHQDRRPRRLYFEAPEPPGPLRNQRPSRVHACIEWTFVPPLASH